ncbi:MAG: cyclic nucleotide-binding domain-containing protein [Patescibacteria group bacterium]|nr:cyclic nucleotide-binding domain-containing protein [Patescibacteria group bacterium]
MINIKELKKITLFKNLKPDELAEIAKISKIKETKKDQELFKAGDKRQEFFIVLSGFLRISREIRDEKQTLAFMSTNNFAVESSLVDPKLKHSHFGEIIEAGKILIIKGKDFIKLRNTNPDLTNKIYGNILKNLTERLHHANNKLLTVYSTGRIASTYANIYNILSLILESILTIIKANQAFFVLFKPLQNKAVIQEATGYKKNQEIKNLNISLDKDPFLYEIFKSGEDIFIDREDFKKDKKWHLPYLKNSALGVKVKAGKDILGAIVIVDKKEENFSYNNQILLNIISRQIASAISTAERLENGQHKREYIKPF